MWVVIESVFMRETQEMEVFSCWGPYESYRAGQGIADEMRRLDRENERDEATYDVIEVIMF